MDVEQRPPLTFAFLEANIEALPEGPASPFEMPRWVRQLSLVGLIGLTVAFVPLLLAKWLPPQQWMLWLARAGVVLAFAGSAPGIVRNVWMLVLGLRQHRAGLIAQFDHDVTQFRRLAAWLADYPREALESNLRYARMGRERLQSRLGMLAGGIERLGLLPVLVSLFVLLRNWQDLLDMPGWLVVVGLLVPALWLIAWLGAEFSRRLHLYAFLLDEALRIRAEQEPKQGSENRGQS